MNVPPDQRAAYGPGWFWNCACPTAATLLSTSVGVISDEPSAGTSHTRTVDELRQASEVPPSQPVSGPLHGWTSPIAVYAAVPSRVSVSLTTLPLSSRHTVRRKDRPQSVVASTAKSDTVHVFWLPCCPPSTWNRRTMLPAWMLARGTVPVRVRVSLVPAVARVPSAARRVSPSYRKIPVPPPCWLAGPLLRKPTETVKVTSASGQEQPATVSAPAAQWWEPVAEDVGGSGKVTDPPSKRACRPPGRVGLSAAGQVGHARVRQRPGSSRAVAPSATGAGLESHSWSVSHVTEPQVPTVPVGTYGVPSRR